MKRRFNRALQLFLAASLVTSLLPAANAYEGIDPLPDLSDYETRVMIDGKYAEGPSPILTGKTVQIPLRSVLEGADYQIIWESATGTAVCTSPYGTEYRLQTTSGTLSKGGEILFEDAGTNIKEGSTFVSLQLFDKMEGMTVSWDGATNTAVVVTDTPDDNLYVYDLGEGLLKNAGRGDTKYRMQGIIGVPEGENNPVAVILHGSHPVETASENRYDLGFSYLVDALADAGYLAVSMNVAINYSFEDGEPSGSERTVQIVQQQLQQLQLAIDGADTAFPVDLTGKGDLSQLVLMGHSRGGGDTFAAAEALPEFAQLKGILALAPSKTTFVEEGVADFPVGLVIPQYDGDVTMLDGATMFEDIRGNDTQTAELVYLEGGNHGGFSTALVKPDPFGRPEDWDKIMSPQKQQDFTVQYAKAFMESVTQEGTAPLASQGTIPDDLYGYPVVIRTYHEETTVFTAQEADLSAIVSHGAQAEAVYTSYSPDSTAGTFHLPGSFLRYDLLSITWEEAGASVTVPVTGSKGTALRIDLSQDSSQHLNAGRDLSLTVTVTDSKGGKATVELPAGCAPLRHQKGEHLTYDNWDGSQTVFYSTFTPLGSIRLTGDQLEGVDLEMLETVTLTMNDPSGAMMLREIAVEETL